jgi:hypothetical protein
MSGTTSLQETATLTRPEECGAHHDGLAIALDHPYRSIPEATVEETRSIALSWLRRLPFAIISRWKSQARTASIQYGNSTRKKQFGRVGVHLGRYSPEHEYAVSSSFARPLDIVGNAPAPMRLFAANPPPATVEPSQIAPHRYDNHHPYVRSFHIPPFGPSSLPYRRPPTLSHCPCCGLPKHDWVPQTLHKALLLRHSVTVRK